MLGVGCCGRHVSPHPSPRVLQAYTGATRYGADSHKAWHAWALCNVTALAHIEAGAAQEGAAEMYTERQLEHVVHALKGFFRSITLRASRGSEHALQDLLRLLTLWFRYGGEQQVEAALLEGFDAVDIDTWLLVIPQVIARINAPNMRVRKSVHALLLRVGRQHPQALIYPLAVASHEARNQNLAASSRGRWAERILQSMRAHCDALVEQAAVVVAAAPVAAAVAPFVSNPHPGDGSPTSPHCHPSGAPRLERAQPRGDPVGRAMARIARAVVPPILLLRAAGEGL